MKDLPISAQVIAAIAFVTGFILLVNGLIMVIIGAVGSIFDIVTFQFISFWEVVILSIIYGLFNAATRK
jgi:hypothetical protein